MQSVCAWLKEGYAVWYVTVIKTWGTSPRPVGSLFAYNPVTDEVSGSLSGGCVEQDLIDELIQLGNATRPFKKLYGVNEQERSQFLLPCGGRLELVVEYVATDSSYLEHFSEIAACLRNRNSIIRSVNLDSGRIALLHADPSELRENVSLNHQETDLRHRIGPQYKLLILGVGDITDYLVSLAISAEFSVTVCDPREAFLKRSGSSDRLSNQHVERLACLPDDLIQERFSDPCCAVVALAHDPRVDDLALMAALDSDAFFVGAIGSRVTCSKRLDRLSSLGMASGSLAQLHAPIGLPIHSQTPFEIAISIMAQLIKKRHLHSV